MWTTNYIALKCVQVKKKINRVNKEDIIYLDALSVETIDVENWQQGHEEKYV